MMMSSDGLGSEWKPIWGCAAMAVAKMVVSRDLRLVYGRMWCDSKAWKRRGVVRALCECPWRPGTGSGVGGRQSWHAARRSRSDLVTPWDLGLTGRLVVLWKGVGQPLESWMGLLDGMG